MEGLDFSALSFDQRLEREWLVTNGIGGFASSTVLGLHIRKYHGLLVAAMSPPVRRMVVLSRVEEMVRSNGHAESLATNEYPGTIFPDGHLRLVAFGHHPFPRWAYQGDGWTIEKGLQLIQGENTVCISYTLLAGTRSVELELRPMFALRGIHELMYQWNGRLDAEEKSRSHHRIPPTSRTPEAFFAHDGAFAPESLWYLNTIYRHEQERGYAGLEDLFSPGAVKWTLSPGQTVRFVCSTEPIEFEEIVSRAGRQVEAPGVGDVVAPMPNVAEALPTEALVRAANQFIAVAPMEGSTATCASIITDFPWAAPSVRNALIALPGVLLVTGKFDEARSLLRAIIAKMDAGVAPSEFPEDAGPPPHKSADASLWLANAIHHYFRYTGDESATKQFLEPLAEMIRRYRHGTHLGIIADSDGLLASHVPGAGTTWMDAKVGDWVITPRQGRPVELNALWYNAARIAANLARRFGQMLIEDDCTALADSVQRAFNRRFWNEHAGCCFDVIDDHGFDASFRPNQLLAISLPFAVLAPDRHAAVLETVSAQLLTPFGLRTLSPRDPSYQGRYGGNIVMRDRAYHQGTVYPWLLGPLVDAHLRVHGRGEAARKQALTLIEPCLTYLQGDGNGQLCELFDGDAPHRPGGAIASARSVGEILRAYVEGVLDHGPKDVNASSTIAPMRIIPAR